MTITLSKKKLLSAISFLLIMVFWASLFSGGIFAKIGYIKGQIILIALWFISIFFSGQKVKITAISNIIAHSTQVFLLFVFFLINLFYWLLGRGDNMAYGSLVKSLILAVLYITILVQLKNNIQNYRLATIIIIVIYALISIYTIPILFFNPFIARLYEFGKDEIPWFGSWSFFLPIGMAMPCFIATSLKESGFFKFFLLASCFIISIMVILSTFAASILLLIMGVLGLYYQTVKNKSKFVMGIGAILFFIVLFLSLLDISELPQIEHMFYKIPAIFNTSAGIDENDPRIRITLIEVSLNTFIHNPLFGVGLFEAKSDGNNLIGFHSGIIDGLAQYGLFGIIWYFGFLILCFKRLLHSVKFDTNYLINQARLISFILFFIALLGNPVLIESTFCSLVFILVFSPVINNKIVKTKLVVIREK